MRIGIDIRAAQLGAGRRGLGAYTVSLVEALARTAPEHEYVLVALPDAPLPERVAPLAGPGKPCRVAPLPTPRLPWSSRQASSLRLWRPYFRVQHWVRRRELERVARGERLDVLHLPIPVMVQLSFPADARRGAAGCPVVKTLHDVTPLVLRDQFVPSVTPARWDTYVEQLRWYAGADAVVAVSTSARDDGIEYLRLPPERMHVVLNAIPGAYVAVSDVDRLAAVEERYGVRRPYFLVVSGEGVNKNYPRVVEAFARAARAARAAAGELQLVLAGPLNSRTVARLKALAFDLGLDRSQLLLLGYIPEDDLVTLFSNALALVSASLYEGFGMPAAQALRVGTPVLASDRASFPEVVGDAGLLVDPYSTDAIAEGMTRLAVDADLRARLVARGRERARRFGWEQQAREMLELFRRVADRPA